MMLLNNHQCLKGLSFFSYEIAKVWFKENPKTSHTLPIDKSEHG